VLTIADTFSRFSPAVEPRFNFRGADVVEVLERVGRQGGFPAMIRVDQGTEFVSTHRQSFIESFNGKFRAECLNAHWFMSLDDVRRKCEAWRRDYNEERPHSAIATMPRSSSLSDQWRTARPDRNRLEKIQLAGARTGSSSKKPDSNSDWIRRGGNVTSYRKPLDSSGYGG
jgi:transposase InsO family protein